MARSIFSSSWHSVAGLKPRLAPQAQVHRHVYRDQVWYVVQDPTGGCFHRLSPAAYTLVECMDGVKTIQSLWEFANTSGHGDACTQNEVVELLAQLHAADLLQVDSAPDSVALFERKVKRELLANCQACGSRGAYKSSQLVRSSRPPVRQTKQERQSLPS